MVKRYEGLFILNAVSHEDGAKDVIDKITAEITAQGGVVETTQKMDKRPFLRTPDKKRTSGYYVNVIFRVEPAVLQPLRHRLAMNDDIYRVLFTQAPPAAPPVAAAAPQ